MRPAATTRGATQMRISLGLMLLAWIAMTAQELLLFLRPTPYGTPYVEQWERYLPQAVVWNLWAAALPALPFCFWWLARWDREISGRWARLGQGLLLAALVFTTALDQADHELMRFMGLHLSLSVIRTYYNVTAWTTDMAALFAGDRGGPWLPFVALLGISGLLAWAGARLIRREPAPSLARRVSLTALAAFLVLPELVNLGWPGSNRWRRAKPAVFSLYREGQRMVNWGRKPEDLERLVADYQRHWLAESGDTGWAFLDPENPLVRTPSSGGGTSGAAEGTPWNVVYIQLETFRGWDVGYLRPDRTLSPTPFLDSLVAQPGAAYWIRHLSFGPETVNGLFASHCSVKPHTRLSPTAMFTGTRFHCLPQVLRAHGYRAELITGVDPDWDFQTYWLRQWYDSVAFPRRAEDSDREVFRRAAQRARVLGAQPRPFMLTVVSYSNHVPFRSREPQLDLVRSTRPDSAIWNTMRYTDNVVGEFIHRLRQEPWFGHTLIVITGDHGENFGEHGQAAGQRNGWRETIWVPLIIYGDHPDLPHGRREEVASLLDIAPTVADLLGFREPVPWMGHSLAQPVPRSRTVSGRRITAIFAEQGQYSMVVDPATGTPYLYDALEDPLQRLDLASGMPELAARLEQRTLAEQRLTDYLLEANRVWPDTVAR